MSTEIVRFLNLRKPHAGAAPTGVFHLGRALDSWQVQPGRT